MTTFVTSSCSTLLNGDDDDDVEDDDDENEWNDQVRLISITKFQTRGSSGGQPLSSRPASEEEITNRRQLQVVMTIDKQTEVTDHDQEPMMVTTTIPGSHVFLNVK